MDEKLLKLIASSAYAAYMQSLYGSIVHPHAKFYQDRMTNPEVGDLVLEISSLPIVIRNNLSFVNNIGRVKLIGEYTVLIEKLENSKII